MTGDRSVSADSARTIRRHDGVAHVATTVNERPHVAPVFYIYENGTVSFITGGKKLENIRANPRVAISLYEQLGGHPEDVRQATILGTAALITDEWERVKQYGDMIRTEYYGEPSDQWPTRDSTLVSVDIGSVIK